MVTNKIGCLDPHTNSYTFFLLTKLCRVIHRPTFTRTDVHHVLAFHQDQTFQSVHECYISWFMDHYWTLVSNLTTKKMKSIPLKILYIRWLKWDEARGAHLDMPELNMSFAVLILFFNSMCKAYDMKKIECVCPIPFVSRKLYITSASMQFPACTCKLKWIATSKVRNIKLNQIT